MCHRYLSMCRMLWCEKVLDWLSSCYCPCNENHDVKMLTVFMWHDESPELCFVPVGPRVAAGPLAPLREGHVPGLLLQERAVEETENAELGQRGGLFSILSVYRTPFRYQQGTRHLVFVLYYSNPHTASLTDITVPPTYPSNTLNLG